MATSIPSCQADWPTIIDLSQKLTLATVPEEPEFRWRFVTSGEEPTALPSGECPRYIQALSAIMSGDGLHAEAVASDGAILAAVDATELVEGWLTQLAILAQGSVESTGEMLSSIVNLLIFWRTIADPRSVSASAGLISVVAIANWDQELMPSGDHPVGWLTDVARRLTIPVAGWDQQRQRIRDIVVLAAKIITATDPLPVTPDTTQEQIKAASFCTFSVLLEAKLREALGLEGGWT